MRGQPGALLGHLDSQKTPPNTHERDPLMRSQKGIGAKPLVRVARRNRGDSLIEAGRDHRFDDSVRRDLGNDEFSGRVTRVVNRKESKYLPGVAA